MSGNTLQQCQEELRKAREQAQAAAKLLIRRDIDLTEANEQLVNLNEAKTEFISLAAHQLRTPITTVNWYTEYLIGNKNSLSEEQQLEYLNQVVSSTRHMAELIDTLLMMSSLELSARSREEQDVDVDEILESVKIDQAPLLEEEDIKYSVKNSITKQLYTDPSMFKSIVQNLVSNAIKYTPKSGAVTVTLGEMKNEDTFGGRPVKEDVIAIRVRDTGLGIPAGQQKYIFQRLFRADNAIDNRIKGTGLGLYIVKLMVKQLSGDVWFISEEREGTTFYVTIPLSVVT